MKCHMISLVTSEPLFVFEDFLIIHSCSDSVNCPTLLYCFFSVVIITFVSFFITRFVLNRFSSSFLTTADFSFCLLQKRHWEELGHVKPTVLDRDQERNLQRIATK